MTPATSDSHRVTVFLGCGFAAKYREGGGVFSVPLQWMLGLKRLKLDAVWLEFFPGSGDEAADHKAIRAFQRQLQLYRLGENYCLLYQRKRSDLHELTEMRCFGMRARELRNRLAGPTTLLNLSYSIHPPLLLRFERRIFHGLFATHDQKEGMAAFVAKRPASFRNE